MFSASRLTLVFFLALWGRALAADPTSIANWANHAETGVFLMRSAPGEPLLPATLLKTDVDIQVSGPVARVTVTQSFFNQGQTFAEGVYVFPLPETSAVNAMELIIGERRIVGEIHERAAARKIYEDAKRQGKRAGLVEQQRPNIFTTTVANLPGGERIDVVIEYTEMLAMEDGRFQLHFPMTLTPRYRPAMSEDTVHSLDLPPDHTAPVRDNIEAWRERAGGTTPAPRQPDVSGPIYPQKVFPAHANLATLRATIDAGQEVAVINSRSHDIRSNYDGHSYKIELVEGYAPMDRDFLLSWEPRNQQSQAAFFSEEVDGDHYGLLMLTPPRARTQQPPLPREVIFIIDTSGSMGGESIRQAKASLLDALDRLGADDRFNILEFNSDVNTLFAQPTFASTANLDRARYFVESLKARGGTNILPALSTALNMPGDPEYLRQVLFITDGAVGNEHAIFARLHETLGDARLFTVGIGSAPNRYFMRKAAQFGRGSYTTISSTSAVKAEISRLFTRLEQPVLRDIELALPDGIEAEIWPRRIPDLYAGEPLLLAMKLNRLPASVLVYGNSGERWQQEVVPDAGARHPGVGTVWARRKIAGLMDAIVRGEAEDEVRPLVVDVALQHRLVSRYTSFVAVDKTPVRAGHEPLKREDLPNRMPKGLAFPNTAAGVGQLWLAGVMLALLSLLMGLRLRRLSNAAS